MDVISLPAVQQVESNDPESYGAVACKENSTIESKSTAPNSATREAAIQKLRAALEDYEVSGPVTNIEFIKRMCVSPDFVAGDVETGYIQKHHAELFTPEPTAPEVYAQAALGLALQEISKDKREMWLLLHFPFLSLQEGDQEC